MHNISASQQLALNQNKTFAVTLKNNEQQVAEMLRTKPVTVA